jgi:2-polyprenyl-3-methyl-5-hydroxy-6-metoxy-1,4-benzoquinol methylase
MKKICPLCGNKNTYKFWEENNYISNKCPNCKLVFIVNKPSKSQLTKYYNDKSDKDLSINLPTKTKKVACSYFLSKIRQYKKNGNLLELGPGYGLFLSMAKNMGFNVYGIEINQKQIDYLSKKLKLNIYKGLIEDKVKKLGTNEYDIIYHWDVLSHLYNPVKTFIELNRILKKDGLLIFETGNYGTVSKFWYRLKKKVSYPEHLYFFSNESVEKLLRSSNFIKLKKYSASTIFLILAQLIKSKNKNSIVKMSKLNYHKKKSKKESLKNLFLKLLFQLSLILGKI